MPAGSQPRSPIETSSASIDSVPRSQVIQPGQHELVAR